MWLLEEAAAYGAGVEGRERELELELEQGLVRGQGRGRGRDEDEEGMRMRMRKGEGLWVGVLAQRTPVPVWFAILGVRAVGARADRGKGARRLLGLG